MTKNDVEIKSIVQNDYDLPTKELDGIYTKTTLFLMNMVDVNMYKATIKPYFINGFLDDKAHDHCHVRPVFVLFKTKDYKELGWIIAFNELAQLSTYIMSYDVGVDQANNHLIMMVFSTPEEFKEDYYHFKRGQYSKFSPKYKSKFFETVPGPTGTYVPATAYGAVYKKQWLRDKLAKRCGWTVQEVEEVGEYWDKPDRKREYYRFDQKPPKREADAKAEKKGSGDSVESGKAAGTQVDTGTDLQVQH